MRNQYILMQQWYKYKLEESVVTKTSCKPCVLSTDTTHYNYRGTHWKLLAGSLAMILRQNLNMPLLVTSVFVNMQHQLCAMQGAQDTHTCALTEPPQ